MTDCKNNSGDRNSGDFNSGNFNNGYRNSGDFNSGNFNSGDFNNGNFNSGDFNSGYRNSGDFNSGYRNSGDFNSGNFNSGYFNSGYRNSGYFNSGNFNSGYFNSNAPKVRLFNKDSDLEFNCKELNKLHLIILRNLKTVCAWIEEAKMTDEEKKNNPTYKTTGGYLKKRDYKYCWSKFWEKITQEEKDFIKSLPNFNAEIFEEITGIKVNQEKKKVTLELTDEELEKIKEIINN